MTLEEYAATVAAKLTEARNSSAASECLEKADQRLAEDRIIGADYQRFWSTVRRRFSSGKVIIERQENSSLHALILFIQSQIESRTLSK